MLIIRSMEALVREVSHRHARHRGLLAIEGQDGSGKTTLSMRLARHVNATRIALDSYLDPSSPSDTFDDVAARQLRSDVLWLQDQGRLVILEGRCVADRALQADLDVGTLIQLQPAQGALRHAGSSAHASFPSRRVRAIRRRGLPSESSAMRINTFVQWRLVH
ncbi:nucleoside/nucleotide kinase family protein [Bacillus paranthracis]|uniref:hypothetical protein n=1 Tax=Bacillus paranthracis TaxID=2026186 RepID=UPI0037F146FD